MTEPCLQERENKRKKTLPPKAGGIG
jgi:hypothetical protein